MLGWNSNFVCFGLNFWFRCDWWQICSFFFFVLFHFDECLWFNWLRQTLTKHQQIHVYTIVTHVSDVCMRIIYSLRGKLWIVNNLQHLYRATNETARCTSNFVLEFALKHENHFGFCRCFILNANLHWESMWQHQFSANESNWRKKKIVAFTNKG